MKKNLFIDRDGTIIKEAPPVYRVDSFSKLEFYPHVFEFLGKIARELDYELVMVTNQDGLGRPEFPESVFQPVHDLVMKSFANEGIFFSAVYIDRSYPAENKNTRKPGTGMLTAYMNDPAYDILHSFVIGDRITDMQLAKNLGCKGFWLKEDALLGAAEINDTVEKLRQDTILLESPDWEAIYHYLKNLPEAN
jgi:imidazoleglycerol-phosphate dehydratase/histidinol-phosphatase